MSNGKSSNQRGYSKKDRIIAQIMVFLLTVSMMPYQALTAAAAETKRVKSVEDIQTEYEVDNGTPKDEIGLPSSLSVVIETTQSADGKTKEEPSRTEEEVREDILWDGDYDGDSAGTYELEARFKDKKLAYEDMPVVHVTVREPEPEPEEEAAEEAEAEEAAQDNAKAAEAAEEADEVEEEADPEDTEEAAEPEDTEEAAEPEDTEEASQPEDTEEASQAEDTDEPAQAEDTEEEAQAEDTEEPAQTEDTEEAAQPEDTEEAVEADSSETAETAETDQEAVEEEQEAESADRPAKAAGEGNEGEQPAAEGEGQETNAGQTRAAISPEELAEQLYGDGGTARTFTVTLKDDKHNTSPNDVTRAGNNIGYNINVSMQAAATYKYDGQNSEVMFSEWKNIGIYLKLPENVRFTEIKWCATRQEDSE